ncbi:MAG TPA: zinc ribbon domain-containing protein [Pyrinomonadaceae bacterium]|jgi:hypothetical protein
MFCPQCGQEQISEQTRFCSRCGFLLTGVGELLTNGGVIQNSMQSESNKTISPRKRGVRQGLFIFLLTFLVVPIIAVLTIWAGAEPYGVAISAILLFVGGLLRMAYALMFESSDTDDSVFGQNVISKTQQLLNKKPQANALPEHQSVPASAYVPPGNWRDTNDLTPTSIVDNTTKLLQKDK